MRERFDVLIVGAGVAGLSCAAALDAQGVQVRVLERSRRPGGRCSSKPPEEGGLVADFGPVFLHGDDPDFLTLVAGLGSELIEGWPRIVVGSGTPCQPAAFDEGQRRFAVRGGLGRLAERLAGPLDLAAGEEAVSWSWETDGFRVKGASGRDYRCGDLVFAMAAEQTSALLARGAGGVGQAEVQGARALLAPFSSLPVLTVLAQYAPGTPVPPWDLCYPETSRELLLVSNESSKRGSPADGTLLTLQARPGWSAVRLEADRSRWATELLAAAEPWTGSWVTDPRAVLTHRWKFGRLGPADHLVAPVLYGAAGATGRLGLTGDLFDADGGVQGAWRSGIRLARRLLSAQALS